MPPILTTAMKAFIFYQGKVLIIREAPTYQTGTQIGKYDVVGGRMHAGEHFDEGLRREAREEIGLDITIGQPFFINESWPEIHGQQNQIVRVFFRCESVSKAVNLSNDHDDYLWINPADYKKFNIINNLLPAFELLIQ